MRHIIERVGKTTVAKTECARGLDTVLAPGELPVYVRRTARVRTQENSACMH